MTRGLLVFGDQTASEIVSIAEEVCGDQFDAIRKFVFHERIGEDPDFCGFVKKCSKIHYIIGITDVRLKPKVKEFADSFGMTPVSVIHPTAFIAPSARIGRGVFIAPYAVVSVNTYIDDHTIVHFHCSVGHDSRIGKFCATLPGARISGHVTLHDRVIVGSSAFIFPSVTIYAGAVVDALTYVRHNVDAKHTVSCRKLKK